MSRKKVKRTELARRVFTQEFKQDAVQVLLDDHATSSAMLTHGSTGEVMRMTGLVA